jgi:flagellar hook-associated protein 2
MAVTVNTSGLMTSSGFDVQGLVDKMIQAEQAPEQVWKDQQSELNGQSSALSVLSSQLGSLNSSVESLHDLFGVFSARTAGSSDEATVSATAGTDAAVGQHSVLVTSLAGRGAYYSNTSIATGDTVVSGGSMTIVVGSSSQQVTIGGTTNTLNKLVSKINALAMSVTASVINDASGARLSIVSKATGRANDVTVTTTADSALTFTRATSGVDAVATVDGIPVSSSSNTLANVIPGVALTLNGQKPGVPVTITVSPDTGRVSQAVSNFINNYNAITKGINAQYTYDPVSGAAGPLSGDASVRGVQQRLMQAISGVKLASGNLTTLRSIGISMNDDGTLSLNTTALDSALASQYSDVQTFFQDPNHGFATSLSTVMDSLTDSVNGAFVVDLKGINDMQKQLATSITDFEDRLVLKRQQFVDQMSQVNALLQQLPTTQNQIDAMLGSLNVSSSSKK